MKRLFESSPWNDEATRAPDSSYVPGDGCSSSSSTSSPYKQSSSPPLSAALEHRRTGMRQDRMPRVEAPLSAGSLKREYDLDTLRMHERRVRHALAQGRPLRPPPRLPTHPPSTSKASLVFPSLVESRNFSGHIIIDDDEDLGHCDSRAATNLVTPTYPRSMHHGGASQRTIVSVSDESDMISLLDDHGGDDDHGWESDDDDEDDGIFELDLE
jgi:hypothetical protein